MTRYRIPEMTRHIAKHDMIEAHTELPPLADPRTRLLFAFLNEQGLVKEKSELYTLVVSLVQLGMDTHDLIDTETTQRSEQEMRSRQLKVLAGDYFSARFYQLLAEAGQVEMIAKISSSVCEVNRLKINLYSQMRGLRLSAEEYFSQAIQIRSELFQHFSRLMDGSLSQTWSELLYCVSRCEVALDELERSENTKLFAKSWAYWHIIRAGTDEERHRMASRALNEHDIESLNQKYYIREQLTYRLKQAAGSLIAYAAKLESDKLASELVGIADGIISKLSAGMPALNEMR